MSERTKGERAGWRAERRREKGGGNVRKPLLPTAQEGVEKARSNTHQQTDLVLHLESRAGSFDRLEMEQEEAVDIDMS